jgi:hypothetical protein
MKVMKIQNATAGPLTVIALTLLGLSACGSSSLTSNDVGGTDSSTTLNVCTMLPSSQVAAVDGSAVAQAIPDQLDSWPDPDAYDCEYDLDNGQEITAEVTVTTSTSGFDAGRFGLGGGGAFPVTSVPGLGSQAAESANGLIVLTSRDLLEISGSPGQQSGDPAGEVKLARILISALG